MHPVDEISKYDCPICEVRYNTQNRKPMVSCKRQHIVCEVCLPLLKVCSGGCAGAIDPDYLKDKVLFRAYYDKLLKKENHPQEKVQKGIAHLNLGAPAAPAAQAPAPIVVAQPKPAFAVPDSFYCLSLCEEALSYVSVKDKVKAAVPHVLKAMNWGQDAGSDLLGELDTGTWLYFYDPKTEVSKGIVQLKTVDKCNEIHWMGVTAPDPDLYLDLFKRVMASQVNPENPTKIRFHMQSEGSFRWPVKKYIAIHEIEASSSFIDRTTWIQDEIVIQPDRSKWKIPEKTAYFVLERDKSIMDYCNVELFMLDNKLYDFQDLCENELSRDIFSSFSRCPGNYFFYFIEGEAKGIVRFNRVEQELVVEYCHLLKEHAKFSTHFVREFINWAMCNCTIAKGVKAKSVGFKSECTQSMSLRTAIGNAIHEQLANER